MGVYLGKARVMWSQVVVTLQKEFDAAGLDVQLPKEPPTRQNLTRMVNNAIKPLSDPLEGAWRDTQKVMGEASLVPNPPTPPKPVTPPSTEPANKPSDAFGSWGNPTNPSPSNSTNFGSWSSTDKDA